MQQIIITLQADERLLNAIDGLAKTVLEFIKTHSDIQTQTVIANVSTAQPTAQSQAPLMPTPTPQPQTVATPQSVPVMPTIQQQPASEPTAQTATSAQPAARPNQPEQAVPTAEPTYTYDQLAVAATSLLDAGRKDELMSLLAQFGVQALTELKPEQYGAFATALRQLGARI